jgi:hypothetical protein
MGQFKEERRKLVFEILDKYPDLSVRTTANILFMKHPGFFDNYELARGFVRYYRGKSGNNHRENCTNKKYFR